jgi:D-alanine transfer protein
MKKYSFGPLLLAILLFLVFIFIPNSWIGSLITDKKVTASATALNPLMFQGKYLQERAIESNKYYPIYGSSELSRMDPFHPSDYFAVNNKGFTPYLVGRGGTQSLVNFLSLSQNADKLRGKKIVFIVSPQWFHTSGTDESHFAPNYSILQGYELAFNNSLSPDVKKRAMKRLLKFKEVKNDLMLSTLYRAQVNGSNKDKLKADLVRPAAYLYKALLEKKDLYYSLYPSKQPTRVIRPSLVKNKSWKQLEKAAAKYAKPRTGRNNPYFIDNNIYKHSVKRVLKKYKNINKHYSYVKSVEYGDFQLVLDMLKQAGAKPIFVSIPVNGRWYDYTGFPRKNLNAYYKKIHAQIKREGFPVLDLSKHAYEPYFFKDSMHISYKGWVYLDKAMQEQWTKK